MSINRELITHNAKTKIYPNGKLSTSVCSKPIYIEQGYEVSGNCKHISKPQSKNNIVRDDSLSRAKSKVFDIGLLNFDKWKYFVTLTFNNDFIDRSNSENIRKAIQNKFKNMVSRNDFMYVLVPEYHHDGNNIHCHMLCNGNIQVIDSGTVLIPKFDKPVNRDKALKLCADISKYRTVYNLPQWDYGFSTAIEINGDVENTIKYITKYITKDCKKIFGNFYLAGGKNLKRDVPFVLSDVEYYSIDEKEYSVPDINLGFKYINSKVGVFDDN